jgi:hypothetical protein
MNLNSWWQTVRRKHEAIRGGLFGAGIAFLVAATLIEGGLANDHGLRSLGASLMICALLTSLAQRFQKTVPVSP